MRLHQLSRYPNKLVCSSQFIIPSRRFLATVTNRAAVPQTLTEKIVQKYAIGTGGKMVKAGDYVAIQPHHCMTHDNSWPVAKKLMSMGATKIHNPRQVVMTLDHDVQNKSEANLAKYANIENFAKLMGVDFYPAGRGIGHQILVEEGYAWPGTLTVASDSHSNMYGGVSCLGTPIVRTDAAAIWATGRTWWQIPPVAKVEFKGLLPKGVTGKDVIVALCGLFSDDQVLNHAIEFVGSAETMSSIPIDDRLTIANMTTEWGALSGLFPADWVLREWLRNKASEHANNLSQTLTPKETKGRDNSTSSETEPRSSIKKHPRLTHEKVEQLWADPTFSKQSDQNATFAKHLILDLSTLTPYVAGPNSVKLATPVDKLEEQKIKIDKAYLVSCTNSRASDIAAAADVFRAKSSDPSAPIPLNAPKVADGVDFYIAPASTFEQGIAKRRGDWQTLLNAGAKALPAGCGPCIGLGTGLLEEGETGISATNRNFKGRMGSPKAFAYLSSPEIVAASAISGYISSPGNFIPDRFKTPPVPIHLDISSSQSPELPNLQTSPESLTSILPGFPKTISGQLLFTTQNNINTDGIYPGKYTYQDNIDKATMSKVCMENYDPEFQSLAQEGDILVAGYNFGCGSSREQAATALLAKGIKLVVGGSFSNIFSRNGINNALLTVEVPRLTERLREVFEREISGGTLTIRTGWRLEWDVGKSTITVFEGQADNSERKNVEGITKWSVAVGSLGTNVQEIVLAGGLEGWVKSKLAA